MDVDVPGDKRRGQARPLHRQVRPRWRPSFSKGPVALSAQSQPTHRRVSSRNARSAKQCFP